MVELVCGPYSLGQWVKSLVMHLMLFTWQPSSNPPEKVAQIVFFGNPTAD